MRPLMTAALMSLALSVSIAPSPTPAAVSAMALPDCSGAPSAQPSQVVLTCADAGVTASKLQWTGWGNAFAAAVGTAEVNDCKPYCAAGHVHAFKIVLLAQGRQSCPDGRPAYARVTYAFIGRSPYADASAPDPVVSFPCGPRK